MMEEVLLLESLGFLGYASEISTIVHAFFISFILVLTVDKYEER